MSANRDKLYLVVRHVRDSQKWPNEWIDDERLASITTTAQIGKFCREAKDIGEEVYVHRCGLINGADKLHPIICCSVSVSEVGEPIGSNVIVKFSNQKVLNRQPLVRPELKQNYYWQI
jgi:hypothetical protein